MILSMTGYGRGEASRGDKSYVVEIKSLNSKSTDIRCKLPDGFVQEEILIRQLVTEHVLRGRIEVILTENSETPIDSVSVNSALIKAYYSKLKKLTDELGEDSSTLLPTILRMQDLMAAPVQPPSEEDWLLVREALKKAIDNIQQFRLTEGNILAEDLLQRSQNIAELLTQVDQYEKPRLDKIKDRLKKNLEEFLQSEKVDHNRFEQEVLFYIEKLDITEEKIRLKQHCNYFSDQLKNSEEKSGKVLAFIAQEMGREINTLGSKAQDFDLQQIVVKMKDELEKIKEQLANVL